MNRRPMPVVNATTFKTITQTAAYVLGILGANSAQNWVDTHTAVLIAAGVAVVNVGGDLLAAFHAQQKTTPVDDPRALDGTPLVPATSTAPHPEPVATDIVTAAPLDD